MTEGTPRFKILIIEDNPASRKLLKKIIGSTYEIYEAEDGLVGIQIAIQQKPDLILLDIHLPGLDGLEMAAAIKREIGDVAIIAVTADHSAATKTKASSVCSDYITQPIDAQKFALRIAKFFSTKK